MRSMALVIASRVIETVAVAMLIVVWMGGAAWIPNSLLPHGSAPPYYGGLMITVLWLWLTGKWIRKPLSRGSRGFIVVAVVFWLGVLVTAGAREGWTPVALAAFAGVGVMSTVTVVWDFADRAFALGRRLRAPREAPGLPIGAS